MSGGTVPAIKAPSLARLERGIQGVRRAQGRICYAPVFRWWLFLTGKTRPSHAQGGEESL